MTIAKTLSSDMFMSMDYPISMIDESPERGNNVKRCSSCNLSKELLIMDEDGSRIMSTRSSRKTSIGRFTEEMWEVKDNNKRECETSEFLTVKERTWEIDPTRIVLKNVISRGPYGIVYSGSFDDLEVSVKLLDWGEEDTMSRAHLSVLRNAFLCEVESWSVISHQNITKFIGASVSKDGFVIPSFLKGKNGEIRIGGNTCCLVLEQIACGTLRDYLTRNGPRKLKLRARIQLALDVARGLSYLHSKGINHLSIKTQNIVVDRKGTAKISDFGASCIDTKTTCLDASSSPAYDFVAPEVTQGKSYTEKADVYSFGFCLWEIYIADKSISDKELDMVQSDPTTLPRIPSSCPDGLSKLISRCWDPLPAERPTMKEVVKMLEVMLKLEHKFKFHALRKLMCRN